MITIQNENVLVHHGILGMKWGVRRFQNPDGSLTPAGEKRYNRMETRRTKLADKAKKNSEMSLQRSKEAAKNVRDLKKNGVNSEAYREWKKNQDIDRSAKLYAKTGGHYDYTFLKIINDIGDKIGADTKVQELLEKNSEAAKRYKKEAKTWMKNNQTLLDMPITALTKNSELYERYLASD